MAATAILILTAQHFFQAGTRARSEGLAAAPAGSLPHEYKARSDSPPAVRRANWKAILWRIYERSNDDRLLATAGGVVFFGLLAVFPAVTALVSSYGLFADPSTIGANLQTLALMLPEGSFQIVQDQIARVIDQGNAALGGTFLFGLALALWSANAGVKAIIDALNVVYEVRETRNFLKLNLLSLAFTTGGIVALLLMVSAVVAFPLLFSHLGLAAGEPGLSSAWRVGRCCWRFCWWRSACSTDLDPTGPRHGGNGWARARSPRRCSGSPAPPRCPGTSRISATTTRPTARLAPPSA